MHDVHFYSLVYSIYNIFIKVPEDLPTLYNKAELFLFIFKHFILTFLLHYIITLIICIHLSNFKNTRHPYCFK